MPDVCFYFQVHQPRRLRRYSVFETEPSYFDDDANNRILRRVAQKCYLPATNLLLRQIERHGGRFVVAFSLTGQVIEQLQRWSPEVLDNFRKLSETGCCEFLAETYDHSLASLYSPDEFLHQVARHEELIDHLFGQSPSVFRNTELIYANALAKQLAKQGKYRGALAEGVDSLLDGRSPNHIYQSPGKHTLPILLKNHRLSDDLAFRFSDPNWPHYPLKPTTYANWIKEASGDVVNLFIDFETFGEHQWEQTGIFGFLDNLPDAVLSTGSKFLTPSQAIEAYDSVDTYDAPQVTSWADSERDISAWQGNAMQSAALNDLYAIEEAVKATHNPKLIQDWQALSTSDHFYYMCTKYYADAAVHAYFNPYESPYDAYINYMNVLDNLKGRLEALTNED